MIEMVIHGRGGQGGVTLAKLIATAYFRLGKEVQAFGVYAAERSGAPVQAYVRVDDDEITNSNPIRTPDHLIVLDRTLISPAILFGAKPGGWIILNSTDGPAAFADLFPGRQVATVDATRVALDNGLGTRAVPIVNTTLFGAAARVLGLTIEDVESTLAESKFGGANVTAAREAFGCVALEHLAGAATALQRSPTAGSVPGLLDADTGERPRIKTGDWANRQPSRVQFTPPCNATCPAGNDVQGFIDAIAKQNLDHALEILLRTTPFPGVCGRVCPAPCMDACNRRQFDAAINVRELERYVADHAQRPKTEKPWKTQRVAVIGSGPAGLSSAYALSQLGYPVTVFEADRELGGLLRTAIPTYRLPRGVVDAEIEYILQGGVEARTNHPIDAEELQRLTHRFDAVLIATGLQKLQSIELDGASNVVAQGIDFLNRTRTQAESLHGMRVVVIGGGNTAIDAARSARRAGATSVQILYRRSRAEMPAIREEIDEALEEGIVLDELVAPLTLRRDGLGPLLTCQRMRLGEPDASGRRRPIPEDTEDAQFDLRCDRVILAIGQSGDLSILPPGWELRDGAVARVPADVPIFACGDLAVNEGTVAAAIGSGRRMAERIHQALTCEDSSQSAAPDMAALESIRTQMFQHQPAQRGGLLPPASRRRSFDEVRLGLTDGAESQPALFEAQRCFSCGVCNHCDRCVTHCPEGIMVRNGDGYRFDESYCKGCGVCAAECPRSVIVMEDL